MSKMLYRLDKRELPITTDKRGKQRFPQIAFGDFF